MLSVLRNRAFALVTLAGVVSNVGDWLLMIALPYHVYALTGSALATGAAFMAYEVPRIALSPVAGVLADRYDRRRLVVAANLLSAAAILPLVAVSSSELLWVVYAAIALQACLAHTITPATGALVPQVVAREELTAANAVTGFAGSAGRLVGPALGGAVTAALGFAAAVAFDAMSFAVAAVLVALVRAAPPAAPSVEAAAERSWGLRSRFGADLSDGLRLVRDVPVVRAVFAVNIPVMVGYGVVTVLTVVFVRQALGGGAAEFGWIATAVGVGNLAGAFAVARAGARLPPERLWPLSLAAMGGAYAAAFTTRMLAPALLFLTVGGCGMAGWLVSQQTLLQRAVPNRYLGRVLGAATTASGLCILLGMSLASALPAVVGAAPVLVGAGLLQLLAALLGAWMLRRPTGESSTDDATPAAADGATGT